MQDVFGLFQAVQARALRNNNGSNAIILSIKTWIVQFQRQYLIFKDDSLNSKPFLVEENLIRVHLAITDLNSTDLNSRRSHLQRILLSNVLQ